MENKKSKRYVINLDVSKSRSRGNKTIQVNLKTGTSKRRCSDNCTDTKKNRNIFIYGFFGWMNLKWVIREFCKIYSDEPSFFSKKRFESSIGFIIGQTGMVLYLLHHYKFMTMSEFLLWAGTEFIIAGYYVNQIQKEKRRKSDEYYLEEEDFYSDLEDDENIEPEDTDADLPRNP